MKTVQVEVAKESYELALGIAQFIGTLKEAISDGWDVGDDMPVVMESAIKSLFPALEGITGIPEEWSKNPASVYKAMSIGLVDIIMAAISEG